MSEVTVALGLDTPSSFLGRHSTGGSLGGCVRGGHEFSTVPAGSAVEDVDD